MLDNALIALILSTIVSQETVAGISGTDVQQAFQPTNQGVPSTPTAFIYKIGDHPLGSPYVTDVWVNGVEVHTETQEYETTFQISALSIQSTDNDAQYTASDILNFVRYCLQSQVAIAALVDQGVGILRVEAVRNPYFVDDNNRNEACPSFDFTVQHKQIVTSTSNVIESVEFDVLTV